MRLNYVSVTKDYINSKEKKYIIRGELDCVPPLLWFKQLQILWICSPDLRKLCVEPKLKNNVIVISLLLNQVDILGTINVLKQLIERVNSSYIMKGFYTLPCSLENNIK